MLRNVPRQCWSCSMQSAESVTSYDWSGSSTSWPNPDPADAGPVIQVNADVVAGTSEQMADTAVDVVRSDLEDSRPFDEFPRWPSLGLEGPNLFGMAHWIDLPVADVNLAHPLDARAESPNPYSSRSRLPTPPV
ncbi:MAG: hypothetical protein QOH54_715 [Mycobacterium sp.]|nr:hypothetical protein [Mycobacterium sp.]